MRRTTVLAALTALLLLAALLRVAGFERTFVGGDTVVFAYGDPYYQLRRGLVSFERFPHVLQQDSYVAFPDGVGAPLPPLFHLVLGAAGRLAGDTQHDYETAAALLGPLVGTLLLLPVFLAARRVGGPRTALAAAGLAAVLPVGVLSSGIGNADYHAFVTLLGAVWLWALLEAVRSDVAARRVAAAYAGVAVARTALLATWPGSLLYLGLAEATLLGAELALGRPARFALHGAGLLATAAAIAPVVALSGEPLGGPWSAIGLSWLHVTATLAMAGVALVLAAWERMRPARSIVARASRALLAGAVAAVAVLGPESVRSGLLAAGSFVRGADAWVAGNSEALPLFRFDAQGRWVAPVVLGAFAYLLPLLPLALLWRARAPRLRLPALVLAAWVAVLGALAATQMRYSSELLPSFCIAAAVALSLAARALAPRLGLRNARLAVAGAAAVAVAPGFLVIHGPALAGTVAFLRGPAPPGDRALALPVGTLVRFAEELRALTPETAGFFDGGEHAGYGVICPPNLGHTLLYVGRRPTPAGNFGPYVGPERFADVERFYAATSEVEAVAIARALRSPWVVTSEFGVPKPGMEAWLHDLDGRGGAGAPRLEQFRLVTEGPAGGASLGLLFGVPARRGMPPYKLFEHVPGAWIEVEAAPGTPVEAQVVVRTPLGRRFLHHAAAVADAGGVARLRVPYATDAATPARPEGPWRVRVGERVRTLEVPEQAVRSGGTVRLPAAAEGESGVGAHDA